MTDPVPRREPLIPAWETLRSDYVDTGIPGVCVVRSDPKIDIFVDGGGTRLGAVLAFPEVGPLPISPLTEISVTETRVGGIRCLRVSTDAALLFGTFYLVLADIIRTVVEDGYSATAALDASLARFETLLQTASLLSDERQMGLFGELWLLDRIIPHLGAQALDAWVGPTRQTHDFRLAGNEFEVKTTSGSRRVHTINGFGQLDPSADCRLFLVSLRIVTAGSGGVTLPETIVRIAAKISEFPGAEKRFAQILETVGYRESEAVHYRRRWRLADDARLITVGDGCPRLTRAALNLLPSAFAAGLIQNAAYEIDVEGLGVADGTPDFTAVLPL
jgi:hypothetical protein